jgi:hypothetical protein
VLELSLAGGHAQRVLTIEGVCPYQNFEYREIWKQELRGSTHKLASGELQQVLSHIRSSGLGR